MIDPSFDNTTAMESPGDFLTRSELEVKVADLENKLSLKTQGWESAVQQMRKYAAQIDAFEEALKKNEWDLDNETLSDLAGYFNLTMEREYMVEVTVKFAGSVTVPYDYDIIDLENELSAEISRSYYGDADVEIDLMEDGMEIHYEEI